MEEDDIVDILDNFDSLIERLVDEIDGGYEDNAKFAAMRILDLFKKQSKMNKRAMFMYLLGLASRNESGLTLEEIENG